MVGKRIFLSSLLTFLCLSVKADKSSAGYCEFVHLHLDSPEYFLGEDIRFAATVVNGAGVCSDVESKVLYVDILAPEGYVLSTQKYKIERGRCHGCIPLQPSWLSGLYELRAYTRYMVKQDVKNYFTRVVPVYEEPQGGDYSKRVILGRKRNITFNPQTMPEPRADTTGGMMSVGMLTVDYDTTRLAQPNLVVLKLKGHPNSRLSLSVTDAKESEIAGCGDNMADFLASVRAADCAPASRKIIPEKCLSVYGRVTATSKKFLKDPVERHLPGVKLASVLYGETDTLYFGTATDSLGEFSLKLGDTGGNLLLRYNTQNDSKPLHITVDKWFAPTPRAYTETEQAILRRKVANGISYETKEPVKARGDRYVVGLSHSCIHTSMTDEVEWMRAFVAKDFGFRRAGIKYGDTSNLIFSMLRRWGYPAGIPVRIVSVDGAYPGDNAVPKARHVYDGFGFNFENYDEIVIRTDSAICNAYGYDEVPQYKHMSGYSMNSWSWDIGINVRGRRPLGKPSIVICMMPRKDKGKFTPLLSTNSVSINVPGYSTDRCDRTGAGKTDVDDDSHYRQLYWNPDITLDANGEATVEFYNNSSCKQFVVSAEGITEDGQAVGYKANK